MRPSHFVGLGSGYDMHDESLGGIGLFEEFGEVANVVGVEAMGIRVSAICGPLDGGVWGDDHVVEVTGHAELGGSLDSVGSAGSTPHVPVQHYGRACPDYLGCQVPDQAATLVRSIGVQRVVETLVVEPQHPFVQAEPDGGKRDLEPTSESCLPCTIQPGEQMNPWVHTRIVDTRSRSSACRLRRRATVGAGPTRVHEGSALLQQRRDLVQVGDPLTPPGLFLVRPICRVETRVVVPDRPDPNGSCAAELVAGPVADEHTLLGTSA